VCVPHIQHSLCATHKTLSVCVPHIQHSLCATHKTLSVCVPHIRHSLCVCHTYDTLCVCHTYNILCVCHTYNIQHTTYNICSISVCVANTTHFPPKSPTCVCPPPAAFDFPSDRLPMGGRPPVLSKSLCKHTRGDQWGTRFEFSGSDQSRRQLPKQHSKR